VARRAAVADGQAALDAVRADAADLVISDVMMPDDDRPTGRQRQVRRLHALQLPGAGTSYVTAAAAITTCNIWYIASSISTYSNEL
jgi:CheY-like chemotaxis protein